MKACLNVHVFVSVPGSILLGQMFQNMQQPTVQATSSIKHLPRSIKQIILELEKEESLKPAEVRQIILAAKVEPEDLMPWADFDHPVKDSYGRKLIYAGSQFEIMAMSWRPGDISTIHDHGYTQWGCVQVFGPAEHATFKIEDDGLKTLARWQMKPYDAIGVNHTLLHQMGNLSEDTRFLTLHVYGDLEPSENVTGDARVMDLWNEEIQRVDGGVFFGLLASEIKRTEAGPSPDFPTRLRHMIELGRRIRRIGDHPEISWKEVVRDTFSIKERKALLRFLAELINSNGKVVPNSDWKVLTWELSEAAKWQQQLTGKSQPEDPYEQYAKVYDQLLGEPELKAFTGKYLEFFVNQFLDKAQTDDLELISLGCSTGLVESYLVEKLGFSHELVYGVDLSPAMIERAKIRISADQGDVLTLDPSVKMWDVVYAGHRVFHYVNHQELQQAIQKAAAILKKGGYFIGEFVTPDHHRNFTNVLFSEDQKIISLRDAKVTEKGGLLYHRTKVINVDFTGELMEVHCSKPQDHFLPPLHRVRMYFEEAFDGEVQLFDAVTLAPISEWADSCASTRYILIAQKK